MLAGRGVGNLLAHAMAQVLGGPLWPAAGGDERRVFPAAVRFNAEEAPEAVARVGAGLGTENPAARLEELARLGGFERLRDFGVAEGDLDAVAEAIVERPGAKANPRPASVDDVIGLLRSVW